jgi:hypothetical protein
VSDFIGSLMCVVLVPLRLALSPFVWIWELTGILLDLSGKYKRDFALVDISLGGKP